MNNIRVIDLLNKIANREEVPKKISYDNEIFFYDDDCRDYLSNKQRNWLFDDYSISQIINDEVEVIEEEPRDIEVCGSLFTRSEYNRLAGVEEDEKIKTINDFTTNVGVVDENNVEEYIHILFEQETILYFKINEIIDKLNKGE